MDSPNRRILAEERLAACCAACCAGCRKALTDDDAPFGKASKPEIDKVPGHNDYFDSDGQLLGDESCDDVDGRMNGSCGHDPVWESGLADALGCCGDVSQGASKRKRDNAFTLADLAARSRNARTKSMPTQPAQYSISPMTLPTIYEAFAHECVKRYKEDANSTANCRQMISGASFQEGRHHCLAAIMKHLQLPCPARFYIGITGDPLFRWDNPLYGHKLKYRHRNMQILLKACAATTRAIEKSLVNQFHEDTRLKECIVNERHSPQGPLVEQKEGEHYLYVIWW